MFQRGLEEQWSSGVTRWEQDSNFALMHHRVVNAVWEPRVVVYPRGVANKRSAESGGLCCRRQNRNQIGGGTQARVPDGSVVAKTLRQTIGHHHSCRLRTKWCLNWSSNPYTWNMSPFDHMWTTARTTGSHGVQMTTSGLDEMQLLHVSGQPVTGYHLSRTVGLRDHAAHGVHS